MFKWDSCLCVECGSFIYNRTYCPLNITPIEWSLIIFLGFVAYFFGHKFGKLLGRYNDKDKR